VKTSGAETGSRWHTQAFVNHPRGHWQAAPDVPFCISSVADLADIRGGFGTWSTGLR
jgi:hypothetical protein